MALLDHRYVDDFGTLRSISVCFSKISVFTNDVPFCSHRRNSYVVAHEIHFATLAYSFGGEWTCGNHYGK